MHPIMAFFPGLRTCERQMVKLLPMDTGPLKTAMPTLCLFPCFLL